MSLTVAGVVALVTSCAGTPEVPAESSEAVAQPTVPAGCPNEHGGTCLGALAAGQYTTTTFRPQITYSVPDGWMNMEDLPGNFWLYLEADQDLQNTTRGGSYIGVYSNAHAAAIDCGEAWQDGVGPSPAELAGWYESIPGLTVSTPLPVTIGGRDGLQIDVDLDEGVCSYDGMSGTPLIIGDGVSEMHHVILDDIDVRLIFLESADGGNLTVEIANIREQHSADDFRAQAQTILDALEFASP